MAHVVCFQKRNSQQNIFWVDSGSDLTKIYFNPNCRGGGGGGLQEHVNFSLAKFSKKISGKFQWWFTAQMGSLFYILIPFMILVPLAPKPEASKVSL